MGSRQIVDGVLSDSGQVGLDVLSPGFAYGFGLFETIKFVEGRPCFFKEHYLRLRRAARDAAMALPFDIDEMRAQALRLFEENRVKEGVFKIVLTGEGAGALTVVFLRSVGLELSNDPIRVRLSDTVKASRAFTTKRKTMNYMDNWLELKRAQTHGFDQCLFVNELGKVTECATANVFFFENGALKTPALECGLLDGVIRGQVLEIAEEMGWRVEEGAFDLEEFESAEEVFATSSGKGLRSVSEFSGPRAISFPTVDSERLGELKRRLAEREIASLEGS